MPKVRPYFSWLREVGDLGEADFLASVSVPHLLFEDLPDLDEGDLFTTIRLDANAGGRFQENTQGIVPIEKASNSNAFSMMITMGRAQNNDLVIPDGRVSKFHAYFRQMGQTWLLTDANSTNGTTVDGAPVATERSVELAPNALLVLAGSVQARFLPPAELYARIQQDRMSSR